jgi:hypothetical protein
MRKPILVVAMAILLGGALLVLATDTAADAKSKDKAKKKGPKGHPTFVFVDSTFAPQGTNRIAVNLTNTTGDTDAYHKFYSLFENAMHDKAGFILVTRDEVAVEAQKKGLKSEQEALARRWENERKFDPEMLRRVSTELGLAYYLEGELSEWNSVQVEWSVEGYSHSEVKAEIRIFSGATGQLVYEAHDRVELKSQFHDPRAQGGVVDDLGIQRGGSQVVPPAPPIEEAAEQVAKNLVSMIP